MLSEERSRIRVAISTCPNDTFAFAAMINRQVDWRGLDFEFALMDISQLNDALMRSEFDVTKASFHAALHRTEDTVVLPSGSALGFGVGPLLLAAQPGQTPQAESQLTLCPGPLTTAALLFHLFHWKTARVDHVVFSEIMPRLQQGSADFGVCIHEGRFTWKQLGLSLVEDLGTRWETETGAPLPLGGIMARRDMGDGVISRVQRVLRDSIEFGLSDPASCLPTMRKHAQELNDDVLMQHVELYVNPWTVDLGDTGQTALEMLFQKASGTELVRGGTVPLEVFQG